VIHEGRFRTIGISVFLRRAASGEFEIGDSEIGIGEMGIKRLVI
jgi:hypothetical protein